MSNSRRLVQELWNYSNLLPEDGLSCGDFVVQLKFLLFLKMVDDQSRSPFSKPSPAPAEMERRVDALEELESAGSADLQRTSCLYQSILRKAFAGEL